MTKTESSSKLEGAVDHLVAAEKEARACGRFDSAVFFQQLADAICRRGKEALGCEASVHGADAGELRRELFGFRGEHLGWECGV